MRLHAYGRLLAAYDTSILCREGRGKPWLRKTLPARRWPVASIGEYSGTETLAMFTGDLTVVRAHASGAMEWWTRTLEDIGDVTAIVTCGVARGARPLVVAGLASGCVAVVSLEGASSDVAEYRMYNIFPGHAVTALAETCGYVCAGGAGAGEMALMMLHNDGFPSLSMVRSVSGGEAYPEFEGAPPVPRRICSIAMVPRHDAGAVDGFYVWHCGAWCDDGAEQPQCLVFDLDGDSEVTWTCPEWRVPYDGVPCGGRKRVLALWDGAEHYVLFHNGSEPVLTLWDPEGRAVERGRARLPDEWAQFRDADGRALHIHNVFQVAPDRVSCVVGQVSEFMDWCVSVDDKNQ